MLSEVIKYEDWEQNKNLILNFKKILTGGA